MAVMTLDVNDIMPLKRYKTCASLPPRHIVIMGAFGGGFPLVRLALYVSSALIVESRPQSLALGVALIHILAMLARLCMDCM